MIITFLFTPYGYKFESTNELGRIYENYKATGVKWAIVKPLNYVVSGLMDIRLESIFRFVGEFGEYWSSTKATNNSNQTYHFWGKVYEIHPSTTDASKWGFSVRKELSIILFTPYGYKFEEKHGDATSIRENYKSHDIKWPNRNPWMLNTSGYTYDYNTGSNSTIYDSMYWSGTSHEDITTVYRIYSDSWDLYPSMKINRLYGFSVRQ